MKGRQSQCLAVIKVVTMVTVFMFTQDQVIIITKEQEEEVVRGTSVSAGRGGGGRSVSCAEAR